MRLRKSRLPIPVEPSRADWVAQKKLRRPSYFWREIRQATLQAWTCVLMEDGRMFDGLPSTRRDSKHYAGLERVGSRFGGGRDRFRMAFTSVSLMGLRICFATRS